MDTSPKLVRQFPWRAVIVSGAVLLVLACAGTLTVNGLTQKREVATPANLLAQTPMATVTASMVPTATLDLMQTVTVAQAMAAEADLSRANAEQAAIFAQQTAVAAEVELAGMTATEGAARYTATSQAAIYTATAYYAWVTASAQAASYTATAHPTMVVLMEQVLDDQKQQRIFEAQAPQRIQAVTNAETLKAWEPTTRWVVFVYEILGIVLLAVLAGLGLKKVTLRKTKKQVEETTQTPAGDVDTRIPVLGDLSVFSDWHEPEWMKGVDGVFYERTGEGSWERRNVEIPCTPEQLQEFAKAVMGGERRLGVNGPLKAGWKRLEYVLFRQWLAENGYTGPAARSNGEVEVTPRGMDFLRVVDATGSPAPQYHFRVNGGNYSARSVQERSVQPEGEGVEGGTEEAE